MSVPAVWSCCV